MIWFLQDIGRLNRERQEFEALQVRAPWMSPPVWRFENGALEVDLDVKAGEQVYPLRLRYPSAFPACPPSVFPRDLEVRWSTHQYGVGGELCLEIGPDNWRPETAGAQMIESAHRLLEAERPGSVAAPAREVPSRHRLTPGQELRGIYDRFLLTSGLLDRLSKCGPGTVLRMDVLLVGRGLARTAVIVGLRQAGEADWRDPEVPWQALARHQYVWSGLAVRVPDGAPRPSVGSTADLSGLLASLGTPVPEDSLSTRGHEFFLFFGPGIEPTLVWPLSSGGRVVTHDPVPAETPGASRLDPGHENLSARRVGVVGAGSVGSKVATSLARTGVGRFLLLDGDVLLPGNLVRHDLDWASVGGHKVDELAWRLAVVRPGADISIRRAILTGQEASASVAAALDDLASCDLIVEATADGRIFGLVGSHAAARAKPMAWAEVLEGGIGGLVARSRPGQEPTPLTMRSRILDWCSGMGEPWDRTGSGYASTGDDGTPLVADDADVGVIAAHLARLAIDTLLGRTPSEFPHAAYFVGLRRSWIFREPFDTHPVEVGGPSEEPGRAETPDEVVRENVAFLVSLLPDQTDATDPSA
ncbi:MAG: ThiF family adenylyltransferase [Acetobacteraceae bacterium]|nr:ThiF family adenylyltransferase [Acetobacteraceae bacterium]